MIRIFVSLSQRLFWGVWAIYTPKVGSFDVAGESWRVLETKEAYYT